MSEFYREYFTPGVYIDTHGFPYHPEFPRFLEDRPAPARIPGQLELNVSTTKLPHWTKVVTGFGLAGLLYSTDHWAKPTLKASKLQQRDGLWGLLQRVVDSLEGFLVHGTNYIGHEVSKGAAHSAHGPAHTLNAMAMRWEQLTWNLAYLTRQLELMFKRLRHTVIPREINKQTRPLRVRTRRLEKGQIRETRKTNALRRWTHTEIVRHIKPEIHHLTTVTTKTLPQRIHREELKRGRLQIRQKHDHKLLLKLLPLLTIAGATGLVLKAFTRLGINYLRCLNMKGFGNELCASPPGAGRGLARFWRNFGGLFGDLAALTFIPFLLTDACRLVGVIEGLAIKVQPEIDALVLGIEGFVCGGTANLPSAIEASDLKRAPAMPTGL